MKSYIRYAWRILKLGSDIIIRQWIVLALVIIMFEYGGIELTPVDSWLSFFVVLIFMFSPLERIRFGWQGENHKLQKGEGNER